MTNAVLVTMPPRVRDLLCGYLETDDLRFSRAGDVRIRVGSAAVLVRVVDTSPPVLRVYSLVLSQVPASDELFRRLNDLNREIVFGRLFWMDDHVLAATELVVETLDHEELATACEVLGRIADDFDDVLQAEFGGVRYFDRR